MIEKLVALVLILLLLPFLTVLSLVIIVVDGWPFWYLQKRVGYKEKIFYMLKFRTMVLGADKNRDKLHNEADGPVFKIRNDPRYTKLGKFLSHTGLDELLQLFNVLKGEMSIVGPRPLPVEESAQIPKKYIGRTSVKPGIVSPWVFDGYHNLEFEKWMQSDMEYIRGKSIKSDFVLCIKGIQALKKMVIKETIDILTRSGNSG